MDYIDIGVGEHFVIAVIHLADMILYFSAKATALPCVLLPTANRFLPFLALRGCFIGYNARTEYRPVVVFHNMLLLYTAVKNKASAGGFYMPSTEACLFKCVLYSRQ